MVSLILVMKFYQQNGLLLSQKLELMAALFNRKSLRPILEGFGVKQLVEAHAFIWDKLVELHYLTQRREFVREEVTKKMMPSATYQCEQGCDLRQDYCKGVECIWSNPICAGNKVKNNIEVMAKTIMDYLDTCSSHKEEDKISKREEVKTWL
ncbi:MAG: hypothetical protein ACE5IW_08715 [bacterium]